MGRANPFNLFDFCRYNLDSSETFIPNLIHYCYSTPIEDLSPRRLALLLMVLAIGSLVDLNRPLGSLHGEAYHHLARAAVCEIPLMEEPDFDVLHALVYTGCQSNRYLVWLTSDFTVLHDLVLPHLLRQQKGYWVCLEPDGLRR